MSTIPIEGKIKPLVQGDRVADAADIETTSGSNVQSQLDSVVGVASIGLGWNWADQVGSNPPSGRFSFNNAIPTNATALHLSQQTAVGRVDDLITSLEIGDHVFIQDTTNPANNYLYLVTNAATLVPSGTPYYTLPVANENSNGTFNAANGDRFTFIIFPSTVNTNRQRTINSFVFSQILVNATDPTTFAASLSGVTIAEGDAFIASTGGEPFAAVTSNIAVGDALVALQANPSLTDATQWAVLRGSTSLSINIDEAHFLEQVNVTTSEQFAADASAMGEADFVRFWLRESLVLPGGEDTAGTGIRIDEAQNSSFTQSSSSQNTILYVALPTAYVASTGTDHLRVLVENPDGAIEQNLPFDSAMTEETTLVATGDIFRTSGALGGSFLRYTAGQVVRVERTATFRSFTFFPTVNVTGNIVDLPETSLAAGTQAKLNKTTYVPDDDQFKLDQMVEQSTTSAQEGLEG